MHKIHLYDKILSPIVTEKSTSLSEQKEFIGCLRRNNFVTVLLKQKSNTVSGDFLGRLVLGVEDEQVKVFGATIF